MHIFSSIAEEYERKNRTDLSGRIAFALLRSALQLRPFEVTKLLLRALSLYIFRMNDHKVGG